MRLDLPTPDGPISTPVFPIIHRFSDGVPRRINLICHRLFLRGGLDDKHAFEGEDALHVIVEMHQEGLLSPAASTALGRANG
jgi:hypothetical protein